MGYVYFIHAIGTGRVKIGVTRKNPHKRLESMQTGSPYPLEYVACIPSEQSRRLEKQLHKRFKKFRRHGEWFELSLKQIESVLDEHGIQKGPYIEIKKSNGGLFLYFPDSGKLKIPLETFADLTSEAFAMSYLPTIVEGSMEHGPLIDYDLLAEDYPEMAEGLNQHKRELIDYAQTAKPKEW